MSEAFSQSQTNLFLPSPYDAVQPIVRVEEVTPRETPISLPDQVILQQEEHPQHQEPLPISSDALKSDVHPNFLAKHWRSIGAAALAAGGVAVDLATSDSLGTLTHRLLEAAPWTVGGLAGAEAVWMGGAAIAAVGIGRKIGNPFTLRKRWRNILESSKDNPTFRTGLTINGIGALSTAAVLTAATVNALPHEAWPGAGLLIAADVAQTVAVRAPFLAGRKNVERTSSMSLSVRNATLGDIPVIVELDKRGFKGAYAENVPTDEVIGTMMTKRLTNNPNGMFVAVVGGEVKGFVTAFRTNKPAEAFESWEESTANGTLEGKVIPNGQYLYIANLTVDTKGVPGVALDMLFAKVAAQAINAGVQYGYFCSRIPGFRTWAMAQLRQDKRYSEITRDSIEKAVPRAELDSLAEAYITKRHPVNNEGKDRPLDGELAMYAEIGCEAVKLVPGGFEDYKSLGYEVLHKAPIPAFAAWARRIKPIRQTIGAIVDFVANRPEILKKVF